MSTTLGSPAVGRQTRNLGGSARLARQYRGVVVSEDRRQVALTKLDRLARAGHDTVRFWQESTEVLRPVVPFGFEPCWFTVDPEHLVITGHFNSGLAETPTEIVRSQYVEDDVNSFTELAARPVPAATVVDETHGDPAASWRWENLLVPLGFDDALDAALRVRGTTWGAVSLLHRQGERPFDDSDVGFVARASAALATGTRLGLLLHRVAQDHPERAPAVLIVNADLSFAATTPEARRWLEDLPDTTPYRDDRLPLPVQVAVVRATESDGATLRLRSRSGPWTRIHAAPLTGDRRGQVAVVVEAAQASLTTPVLLFAHELTAREREVVDLVLRGYATEGIAAQLNLSPYTVQDRLKTVFEKVGVRSRRELVARLRAEQSQLLLDESDARSRTRGPAQRA